jgi:ATP-binding cassette, subfamily B, bacterial
MWLRAMADERRRLYESVPLHRALRRSLRLAWSADPARTAARCGLVVVEAGAWSLEPLGLKFLVNAVVRGDAGGAGTAVAMIVALHSVGLLCDWFGFMIGLRLRESMLVAVDVKLIELTSAAPGIEHVERPEYADELLLLRNEREAIAMITDAIGGNLRVATQIGTTVALLATIHPILLLLPLFGIPAIFTGAKATKLAFAAMDDRIEVARSAMLTYQLATKAAAGKEIRVFGLRPELQRHYSAALHKARRIDLATRMRMTAWNAAGWLIFVLGFAGGIGFVAIRAVNGAASVGDVVLALSLAGQITNHVNTVVGTVNWLMGSARSGRRLVWFEDYVAEQTAAQDSTVEVPDRLTGGVKLEDVGFVYPGTDRTVLEHVTVDIPAGSTVAIVGDNGAGKTTLVKLLCRFYEPTSGRITADGVDIATFDVGEWRSRVSAGFQDFVRYELTASETVGIGDLLRVDDSERIAAALQAASASDVVADLPNGPSTQLGKSFDGGVELSGGQWQKLALGRAMMFAEPLLLVLDEPTAALDAQTEHALFDRFTSAARNASRRAGAITVIVSHRFSTVRMADVIIVVEDGRVSEIGTHASLMAQGRTYAELYELQAASYR